MLLLIEECASGVFIWVANNETVERFLDETTSQRLGTIFGFGLNPV